MDVLTHTAIALGCMYATYHWGRYLAKRSMVESVIESMLDNLEKDGLIAVTKNKAGEKDIVPISEVVAKALRDAK